MTVCGTIADPLEEVPGSASSVKVIGSSEKLGNKVVDAIVALLVIFQLYQGMILVVIVGMVNAVVCIVRATSVVIVGFLETITVVVVVQATSIGVTIGSIETVVIEDKVVGVTMILSGAIPVAVFELGLSTSVAI